jgi:hypothetical protein
LQYSGGNKVDSLTGKAAWAFDNKFKTRKTVNLVALLFVNAYLFQIKTVMYYM